MRPSTVISYDFVIAEELLTFLPRLRCLVGVVVIMEEDRVLCQGCGFRADWRSGEIYFVHFIQDRDIPAVRCEECDCCPLQIKRIRHCRRCSVKYLVDIKPLEDEGIENHLYIELIEEIPLTPAAEN